MSDPFGQFNDDGTSATTYVDSNGVRRQKRGDRVLVVPPGRNKPIGYSRVTTWIDVLDDEYNLTRYKIRNTLAGIIANPSLIHRAKDALSPNPDLDAKPVKDALNHIGELAQTAARDYVKRDTGTAVHAMCQQADQAITDGNTPRRALEAITDQEVDGRPYLAADHRADVASYLAARAPYLRPVHIETLVVNDELRVAGTPDRVDQWIGPNTTTPWGEEITAGTLLVTDQKTGRLYGFGEFACQLAIYAHSEQYQQDRDARTPWPLELTRDVAVISHTPIRQGRTELHWLDISAGWVAVRELVTRVRAWRGRRDIGVPFPPLTWRQQVAAAITPEDLRALWKSAPDQVERLLVLARVEELRDQGAPVT